MEEENVSASDIPDSVSWTASEFVAHDKSSTWYLMLFLVAVVVAGLAYFINRDLISVAVVAVAALLIGVYASHQPRQLEYQLDQHGITIGDKSYGFDEFRSFAMQADGAFTNIVFLPLRRFAVPISIYYAPDDEDKIIAILSSQLPFDESHRDSVDSLMRKIRF